MSQNTILWADDEIDLLKPHIIFLRNKGYEVITVNNGADALDVVERVPVNLIILDENMPGLTGLQTLSRIKEKAPTVPVIMITKSEEENIMDQAVGSKIADYLIKPVNPNQILLSIKKNLHAQELVSTASSSGYRNDFGKITSSINESYTVDDWQETYRTLVRWELELADAAPDMHEMLELQKNEANVAIAKFVKKNYGTWVKNMADEAPLMSPRLFKNKIFPLLDAGEKVFFVLIDNFRFDQWRVIRPILSDYFTCDDEMYYSILPTATQYARNAIFSGLMPLDIQKLFPQLWVDEDSDEGKNLNESPLIATQFDRYRRKCRFSYNKINDNAAGERLLRDFASLEDNDLNVVVFNFIDMLSHARTESKMIRELAATNAAYRSLTESWFRHSSAFEFLRKVAESGYKVVLTTDHGTIKVTGPVKVVGEKNTNTNLRYKLGRNLSYNPRQVFEIQRPRDFGLPAPNVSTRYIFATGRDFFAYPNNYSYYVQYYTDTFQHGGVSMEEMLVPVITMIPKQ